MEMTTNNVQQKFLDFMKKEGHSVIGSSSLIPDGDNTTLFTSSGMQPLIKFLKGEEQHSMGNKLANSQVCFRAEDMEEVGDARHTTLFNMLGNWSIGAYWKEKEIEMFFTFLTNKETGLGLDANKLYITVFSGDEESGILADDESVAIWQKQFQKEGIKCEVADIGSIENGDKRGIKGNERIFKYNAEKNWWSRAGKPTDMPNGEIGGPDTEVFYDTGVGKGNHPNSEGGRYVEIGNAVFIEYIKKNNIFEKLPVKSVDFGAGLERLTAVANGYSDIFQVDTLNKYIKNIENISKKTYTDNQKSFRIIADHLNAVDKLAKDGVVSSNTGAGYVMRKLIRRASFQADKLGIKLQTVCESDATLASLVGVEEYAFGRTLINAKREFEKRLTKEGITGEDVFYLQSSFGLPQDMLIELCEEKGITFPYDEFDAEMQKHQDLSRDQSKGKFAGGLAGHSEQEIKYHTATHLLHRALKNILGEELEQKGSNITPERLRFDFSYPEKLTDEQKQKVEDEVNTKIKESLKVEKRTMTKEDAIKEGAIGIFDEKYGDTVSVYTIFGYSKEFCGGPHVENTSELGEFKIVKEESVAAGVRRIKAKLV